MSNAIVASSKRTFSPPISRPEQVAKAEERALKSSPSEAPNFDSNRAVLELFSLVERLDSKSSGAAVAALVKVVEAEAAHSFSRVAFEYLKAAACSQTNAKLRDLVEPEFCKLLCSQKEKVFAEADISKMSRLLRCCEGVEQGGSERCISAALELAVRLLPHQSVSEARSIINSVLSADRSETRAALPALILGLAPMAADLTSPAHEFALSSLLKIANDPRPKICRLADQALEGIATEFQEIWHKEGPQEKVLSVLHRIATTNQRYRVQAAARGISNIEDSLLNNLSTALGEKDHANAELALKKLEGLARGRAMRSANVKGLIDLALQTEVPAGDEFAAKNRVRLLNLIHSQASRPSVYSRLGEATAKLSSIFDVQG